jgi:glycosyltransferase involved in cell wall biosynthesis
MSPETRTNIAILLATYNGIRFLEAQIRSLKGNLRPFTLHWLDDCSTDGTRQVVRSLTRDLNIELREWHQGQHLGVPRAFFRLLERVEADIYLFCDQDDIWQPGKIDATVDNLLPDLASPVLCFSDPLLFDDDVPQVFRRLTEALSLTVPAAQLTSKAFAINLASGHTIGFTRPLREIFLQHRTVAWTYAFMHDWWMYLIAIASGEVRMLRDVPTTLYRLHASGTLGSIARRTGWRNFFPVSERWREVQGDRRQLALNATGFILASKTLPAAAKLDRMLELARLVASIDRRQSPIAFIRLVRRAVWPQPGFSLFWLTMSCLCCDALL